MARLTQSLLLVGLVSLGAPACSGEASPSTTAQDSGLVQELETELAAAQQELASSQEDVEALESTVVQLQADVDRAGEQARKAAAETARSTAEAALATETLDRFESLFESVSRELCPTEAPAIPADLATDLVGWLTTTESSVPAGTEATVSGGVTAQGWWLFSAEFNMRFEPGVFARSPDGEFTVGWGGFASSETAIRAWIHDSVPGMPAALALCVDVGAFVERP